MLLVRHKFNYRELTDKTNNMGFPQERISDSNCDAYGPFYTYALQTWMESWYQKFLVPPPIPGENRTRVNVSISVNNIMDINEQVFIFKQKQCQTTCHCVVLSWWFCLVSQAGVFQVQFYLVMSWLDSNIIFRVRRILNNCICTWTKLKWQGSKWWDSFRQLPFLKFC